MIDRLNEYRVMWILVLYDLPTETKKDRKIAAKFRKNIMGDDIKIFYCQKEKLPNAPYQQLELF